MSMYKHIRKLWKRPKQDLKELWKSRLIKWRREPSTLRIDRPTRLDRARSLGYKAKQGIFVIRQRVLKGGHTRPGNKKGRRPKTQRRRLVLDKNYQQVAEERTSKKYVNCEVLNSYWVAEDGKYKWYEIILVDRAHPAIRSNKNLNWISKQKGRAHRGLTSSARKARGLRNKGKGAEKLRPSKHAAYMRKVR